MDVTHSLRSKFIGCYRASQANSLRKRRETSSKKLQSNGAKEQQVSSVEKPRHCSEACPNVDTFSSCRDFQQSKFFLHSISETKGELYENQSATE